MDDFGKRLRRLREARQLRQVDLARQAGLVRQQINNYEGGRSVPSWPLLQRLARALAVPLDAFDASLDDEEAVALAAGGRGRTRRNPDLVTTAGKGD